MRQNFDEGILERVSFLAGSKDLVRALPGVPVKRPFEERIVAFLNDVSRALLADPQAKKFSDVVTFAFWIRRASILKLRNRFEDDEEGSLRLGRGVAFHIAPSNVPVNFAYSLVAGLLTGNANIVRIPTKDFEQVGMIVRAWNHVLEQYEDMKTYGLLVRYGREKAVNDLFSSMADVRIVWGGDATIAELRKSPLPPRSCEIAFADRYSLAIIDADYYLERADKVKTAEDFYNDTFLTDQNACTSPRIVVWRGERIGEAKAEFWSRLHHLAKERYVIRPVQSVNKLTSACLVSVRMPGCREMETQDNLIFRIAVPELSRDLMDYRDNSGYFFEYDCADIMELRDLCDDKRCQTVAYVGAGEMVLPLIQAGVRGIDRVVPVGKTMDFDLIWDGDDLPALLTRTVASR